MMNNLLLASACGDRLASWKQGLTGFVSTVLITDRLDNLSGSVVRCKPKALLLDYDLLELNSLNNPAGLKRLSAETKVIILSSKIPEYEEDKLFKAGVRGCCRSDVKPEFLNQVVVAVLQGELWMRRTLICRLLNELGDTTAKNNAYQVSLNLLDKFTQREYDIAVRVGRGESNKQIAQACAITERTVKYHLSGIFHKVNVNDRLHLALAISAALNHGDVISSTSQSRSA